ncbi:MAG: hypothetical protein DHS80DRAFT_24523 [Piptocephalis tieghemiana]|nr:MAG: hypothetical protein DHS80DRAFT_24523 [Piptocephalis tieghemiana]
MVGADMLHLERIQRQQRPEWSKVRWISIDRISWDVIKIIATKYDLHPLVIEDIFHIPQRIKVDRYKSGLFCSTIAYTLDSDKPQTDEERHVQSSDQENRRPMGPYGVDHAWSFRRGSYEELSPMDFSVSAEQVFMYLTPQGVLVSIFQREGNWLTDKVEQTLEIQDSLLRRSFDASFLLQSLLDGIVDHGMDTLDKENTERLS